MTDVKSEFQVGDVVELDKEIADTYHGGMWRGLPVVSHPVYMNGPTGHGSDNETTHSVGIRFPHYDYGTSPGNCHMVANNKIRPQLSDEEVDQAIASIKEAAHGH